MGYFLSMPERSAGFDFRLFVFLLLAVLFAAGCKLNTPPIVEIEEGDEVVITNGETAIFSVLISDPDEDQEMSIRWYRNGGLIEGENASQLSIKTDFVASAVTDMIRVEVTDDRGGTGEDSSALTVNPADYAYLDLSGSFTYELDAGSSPRDVYFIFTNTTFSDISGGPTVTPNFSARGIGPGIVGGPFQDLPPVQETAVIKDIPSVSEFNNNPPIGGRTDPRPRGLEYDGEPPPPQSATIGETAPFYVYEEMEITSKYVYTASHNGRTLDIWVEEALYEAVIGPSVEQYMVEALGAAFLKDGASNDIYEWVTSIFGAEWGTHPYTNLIPPDNSVTILLYDIDRDVSTSGGTAGYFWSLNNFKTSQYTDSNEKIMFYADAVLYAQTPNTWDINDPWPSEIRSTLAHELQHMIHYYQKQILFDANTTDTWLNEMCSLVAEDLVADKLGVNGPRGYDSSDGSAGPSGITNPRLPRANYYNDSSLIYWPPSSETDINEFLIHYALSYSFGAYLSRNYGGASLFRKIVQNGADDHRAIETALEDLGYTEEFGKLVRQWGVASILSSSTSAPAFHSLNTGDNFTSSEGGTSYNSGSINLYNYVFTPPSPDQVGPKIYTGSPVGSGTLPKVSNTLFLAAENASGTLSWDITLPSGVEFSVIFK